MTIKKLTKLGNNLALVLDKSILTQMGLSEAGEVQVTLHGQQLVVTPVRPRIPDEKRQESLDKVVGEYDELFRRLA